MWLKASGLAAGKGAIFCRTVNDALVTIDEVMVQRIFGDAGDKLVVMEHMEGEEASIFGFTDGEDMVCISPSQDHKAIGEGDTGPNTGGMGAYAPPPVITPELDREIYERVMLPTVRALAEEGMPYTGILYGGLIITKDGPKVIEFNCRLGDPETQVVLPLLKSDLVDIIEASCNGGIADVPTELDGRAATCVVVASGGYPGSYETGFPVTGLDEAEALDDVVVFHAGTSMAEGQVVTNGGRVLGVTAVGDGIPDSIKRAYEAVEKIEFKNMYFREDIGYRALERLE
jgi:phosphoribosylamine--glycine ligase